jgi:hypothetical protein
MRVHMLIEIDSNIAALKALLASQLAAEKRERGTAGRLLAFSIFNWR